MKTIFITSGERLKYERIEGYRFHAEYKNVFGPDMAAIEEIHVHDFLDTKLDKPPILTWRHDGRPMDQWDVFRLAEAAQSLQNRHACEGDERLMVLSQDCSTLPSHAEAEATIAGFGAVSSPNDGMGETGTFMSACIEDVAVRGKILHVTITSDS